MIAEKAYEGAQFEVADKFRCQACSREDQLVGQIVTNWDEDTVFTCPKCETKTTFWNGEVLRVMPGPGKSL